MVEKPQRRYTQQVTSVTPEDTTNIYAKAAGTLIETGEKIAYQSANAKMANTLAQSQLKLSELTNQFRIENAGNPDWKNPDYVSKRNELFQQMQAEVSPLVKRDFNLKWKELEANNDMSNQAWAIKQNQDNTIYNLQESIKANRQTAYLAGATGNKNYLDLKKNWEFSVKNLYDSSVKVVGDLAAKKTLDNAESDYTIEYASGLMYNNPAEAIEFLNREDVANDINNPEVHLKLKKAATNSLLNFKLRQGITELAISGSTANSLLNESMAGKVSIDKIQSADISGGAKNALMKINSYDITTYDQNLKNVTVSKNTVDLSREFESIFSKRAVEDPDNPEYGKYELSPKASIDKAIKFQEKVADTLASGGIERGLATKWLGASGAVFEAQMNLADPNINSQEFLNNPLAQGYREINTKLNNMGINDVNMKANAFQGFTENLFDTLDSRGVSINDFNSMPRGQRVGILRQALDNTYSEVNIKEDDSIISKPIFDSQLPSSLKEQANKQFMSSITPTMTNEQKSNLAQNIANQVRSENHAKALDLVNKSYKYEPNESDLKLLQSKGYTIDDVKSTASKYGISEEEVIKRLK